MPVRSIALIVLCTAICFSQKNETASLLEKADEVLYDDPAEALKIGEYVFRNTTSHQDKAAAAILLAKGNLARGNYTQSLVHIRPALTEAKASGDKKNRMAALLLAAEIYAHLDLFEISRKYYADAENTAGGTDLKKQSEAYGLFVPDTASHPDYADFVRTLDAKDMAACSFITKGTPLQLMASSLRHSEKPELARDYFEKSLKDIVDHDRGDYWLVKALTEYSDCCFADKDYAKAIGLLEKADEKQKRIRNPYLLKSINEKLSMAWLALGNKAKFREFRQKAALMENDDDTQKTQAINFAFENLQKEKAEKIQLAENSRQNSFWILGFSIGIAILTWLAVRWHFANKSKHLQDIISYLKLIKNTDEKPEASIKPTAKNLSIPKETEALLLAKLEKFESGKKYLSKDISLAQVASLFETNTKYLSEIINKYKKKNFNSYINELRIKYIVEKLKNDPKYLNYKVSYLAEECGFSSHSIFSAVFKGITGITPNVFIQFLSEDAQKESSGQLAQLQ